MDAGIIAFFKAHFKKFVIEHQLECLMAEREFVIAVYQALIMVKRAWCVGVTAQTIRNCWSHTNIFSTFVENEREEVTNRRFS